MAVGEPSFRPKAVSQGITSLKVSEKNDSPDSRVEYKSQNAYDRNRASLSNTSLHQEPLMEVGRPVTDHSHSEWIPDGPSGFHELLGPNPSQSAFSCSPLSRDNTKHPLPNVHNSGTYAAYVAAAGAGGDGGAGGGGGGGGGAGAGGVMRTQSISVSRAASQIHRRSRGASITRITHFSIHTLHDLTGKTGSLIYMAPEVMMGEVSQSPSPTSIS